MLRYLPIRKIHARQVLDSRGNPTVEVEVTVGEGVIGINGYTGRAIVPSGASTGKFEALELRDGDRGNYTGLSVQKAVDNVNTKIAEAILGENALNQTYIDSLLVQTDGTDNKSNLGANATLGVSMAVARAAAMALRIPLYQYIGGCHACRMPVPMMNILNGGAHSSNNIDVQEFMILPVGATTFKEGLRWCAEVYHALKKLLKDKNLSVAVGDEGGFAPDLNNEMEVLDLIIEAVKKAGYIPEKDFKISLDVAASEWKAEVTGKYKLPKKGIELTTDELIDMWSDIVDRYPIFSIEDPLDEEDWDGWKKITEKLGRKIHLVGDDLFVTNTERLSKGIKLGCGNSILIKLNQIGSVSETLEAIKMAHKAGYTAISSHSSGETEDTTIADLAVALNTCQIKTGAPSRSERVAKYNQLLRIEEQLGNAAVYPGKGAFHISR